MKKLLAILIITAATLAAGSAAAQNFPRKMITLIVPQAAGGNLDLVARGLAQALTASLGQQVIVDNRPSSSSLVGTQLVARSAPDGYTLLVMASTFAVVPAILPNAGYNPLKDFVGVSQTCWLPLILVVHPSVPVKSVPELIAYAKAHPGKLNVANSGTGGTGHIAWELFNQHAGPFNVVQIPYKGSAPALIDVLGGQADLTFDTFSTSIQHVKAGKLRALALAGPKRSPIFPDLPTVAEFLPGYDAAIFNGIVAPTGTPKDVLLKLNREIAKAVQQPDLRKKFADQGVELTASESPEQFTEFLHKAVDRFTKLVHDANIKAE
ncbi:MAG TPA: tripartite tricarboxylate transporter substrate binding protein [Candidatus Sulfotelmatobacter sp.]|nr:tripartite tricarboxylate transporter substrate binding protein [Candidatus Sulfotelmatobacter sp.]